MKVFIIAGQSGSGKSTTLHVFEDMHMTTADGVPPNILPDVVHALTSGDPRIDTAIGIAQNRNGFAKELSASLNALRTAGFEPKVLFLKAETAELMRRYATTRRPHPMEREGIGLEMAVLEETDMLAPIMRMADLVIDTTSFSLHDLRRDLQNRLGDPDAQTHRMKINLISFGFKYGTPAEADIMFDVRFLPNPYFELSLRPLSGRDYRIAGYVFSTPEAKEFRSRFIEFVRGIAPLYDKEGRYRLTISIGCTGGRHRSVAVTEALAAALKGDRFPVSVEHRHMNLG